MSLYAKRNGVDVYAQSAAADETLRGESFECPCKKCDAALILKVGEKKKPYFAAIPSAPHIKNCFYGSEMVIDPDEYSMPVNINDLLRVLCEGKGNSERGYGSGRGENTNSTSKKRLRTALTMYRYLKSYPLSKNVGGRLVKETLIDDRSVAEYLGRDVKGLRLVEGYLQDIIFYDSKEKSICLQVPCYYNDKLKVKVIFEDYGLFIQKRDACFDEDGHAKRESRVIVLGDWGTKDGYLTAVIKRKGNFNIIGV